MGTAHSGSFPCNWPLLNDRKLQLSCTSHARSENAHCSLLVQDQEESLRAISGMVCSTHAHSVVMRVNSACTIVQCNFTVF